MAFQYCIQHAKNVSNVMTCDCNGGTLCKKSRGGHMPGGCGKKSRGGHMPGGCDKKSRGGHTPGGCGKKSRGGHTTGGCGNRPAHLARCLNWTLQRPQFSQ